MNSPICHISCMMTLGQKLKNWREQSGLVGNQAAEKLGISQSQWSKYELNLRNVNPSRAAALSELTGIPLHEIRPDVFSAPSQEPAQ